MRRIYSWFLVVAWGCSSHSTDSIQGAGGNLPRGTAGTAGTTETSSGAAWSTGGALGARGGVSAAAGSKGGSDARTSVGGINSGGATARGGATTEGGHSTVAGGATAGGALSLGGRSTSGGATTEGGTRPSGGTTSRGGAAVAGGSLSRGGATSKGGASTTGGVAAVGGATGSGGVAASATPLDGYVRTASPITLNGISNASGIAWKPETDTFFIVSNGTHALYEYAANFATQLRTITLTNGGTDTEDVVYLGSNRFAVVDEENQAYVVSITDGATSASLSAADAEHYVVSAPPATSNRGFEGITFRPGVGSAGQFIVCQEGGVTGTPMRVLFFDRHASAGTFSYADSTLTVQEPWNALSKLGAVATDLAAVCFDSVSSTLLVLSQESSRLLRVTPETGAILEQRDLSGSPQYEGLTLASGGRLVLVSEPNYVEIYQAK